jgi:hypothetical protein
MLKYVVACLNMIDVRRIVLVAVFKWLVLIILAFVVFFGVCVHHIRCGDYPVCYPLSMIDEDICPLIPTSK